MFPLPLSLTTLRQPLVRSYRSIFLKLWAVKELKEDCQLLDSNSQQQSAAVQFPMSAVELLSLSEK